MDLLRFRDDWILSITKDPTGDKDGGSECKYWQALAEAISAAPMEAMRELGRWAWIVSAVNDAIHPPAHIRRDDPRTDARPHSPDGRKPALEHYLNARSPGCLRELDRIFLGTNDCRSPVRPAALTHFGNQHLLVTLQNSGRIVRLYEDGRVFGRFASEHDFDQPVGISADHVGRVWISEPQKNRVTIYDALSNVLSSFAAFYGSQHSLNYPFGIEKASNGSVLLADLRNNRVLVAKSDGNLHVLGAGRTTGFRHPASFCPTPSEDAFWVVDLRNHRLLKMSSEGETLQELGGPGLGRNELILPEFCALFDDGVIVASQWGCVRALKVFSRNGEEIETILLDYCPRGVLVHQGLLLVCSGFGDHIHVYERK